MVLLGMKKVLMIMVIVTFSGCAMYRAHYGVANTDLSELHPGMHGKDIEAIVDEPIEVSITGDSTIAFYTYDRGYIPPIEEHGYSPAWTIPSSLFLEVMSGGLAGAVMEECQIACQKGKLAILYDSSSRLLEVLECTLTLDEIDHHCGVGKTQDHCIYVMGHPRASALPESIENTQLQIIMSDIP